MARKSRKGLAAAPVQPEWKGMKLWRAAFYIRLSKEFNGNRGDSLETQRQIMDAFLARSPDIELVEIYTDNGESGQTFERPSFQKMLEAVETGKIDCIVVKDLSRLGRNAIDTGYYIEKYFPLHHVRFIAVNNQYDSEKKGNSGEHVLVSFTIFMDEAYAKNIGEKIKSQFQQSMKEGEFACGIPPYGYSKDPNNRHKLVVDENAAPIVWQIFQWAADGVSLKEIVRRLNESGVLTPGYYLADVGIFKSQKRRGSGKWHTRTIIHILANAVYTGDMLQGKTKTVGRKLVPVAPEEWIVVRRTHEPLISREQFETVQALRKQAAEKAAEGKKVPFTENILRGRIFCGGCDRKLSRKRMNNNVYYYYCTSNNQIAKGFCNHDFCIRESHLFDLILALIRQQAEIVIGKNLRLKQRRPKLAARKADADREITKLRQDVENNRGFLTSLYENLVTGILTSAEYRSMKTEYEGKITASVERIQELQNQQKELEEQAAGYSSLADMLAGIGKDTALSSPLVGQLIERVTVNSRTDISIRFRFESGFERVEEVISGE